jgi:hypothetical protein
VELDQQQVDTVGMAHQRVDDAVLGALDVHLHDHRAGVAGAFEDKVDRRVAGVVVPARDALAKVAHLAAEETPVTRRQRQRLGKIACGAAAPRQSQRRASRNAAPAMRCANSRASTVWS